MKNEFKRYFFKVPIVRIHTTDIVESGHCRFRSGCISVFELRQHR